MDRQVCVMNIVANRARTHTHTHAHTQTHTHTHTNKQTDVIVFILVEINRRDTVLKLILKGAKFCPI